MKSPSRRKARVEVYRSGAEAVTVAIRINDDCLAS